MTDKEKIRKEIERNIEQCYRLLAQDLLERERNETMCCLQQYKELLQFIDSLPKQPASEDLEEASWNYSDRDGIGYGQRYAMQIDFKAGAEWQHGKDFDDLLQSEMKFPKEFYEKGRFDMREEMMKDAVDAFVNTYDTNDGNYVEFVTEQSPYKFKETEKCKLIIVKEE